MFIVLGNGSVIGRWRHGLEYVGIRNGNTAHATKLHESDQNTMQNCLQRVGRLNKGRGEYQEACPTSYHMFYQHRAVSAIVHINMEARAMPLANKMT